MTRKKSGMHLFSSRDQVIEELLDAQERELAELQKDPEEQRENLDEQRQQQMQMELSVGERLRIIWGAVAAGLLVAGIFIVLFFLFLLFCTKVWMA